MDATSCFVCYGRDLASVVEWLYLKTRWYIWPALISLISFFLLMESPDWKRTSCNMTEPLSNFLEILPGIVEIFGAVLIWGLTCITVALAPDCTTKGTIPMWSLVERKENLSGKNNDRQWSNVLLAWWIDKSHQKIALKHCKCIHIAGLVTTFILLVQGTFLGVQL